MMEFPRNLTLSELHKLGSGTVKVSTSARLRQILDENRRFLESSLDEGTSIYGVTTGFGPLVDREVEPAMLGELQDNLVDQLSEHSGPYVSQEESRMITALRINALSKGVSGVSFELLERLLHLFNSGYTVAYQRWGSVGASGDLVPLSMLPRVLSRNDGLLFGPEGKLCSSADYLQSQRIEVYSFKAKEALALVNGTSFSLGLLAASFVQVKKWINESVLPGLLSFLFLMDESFQHLSPKVYAYKNHPAVRDLLRQIEPWLAGFNVEESPGTPQPPYSSRSMMLWMGRVQEHLQHARSMMETELNSVDDNPLFLNDENLILHAANFQGSFVSYAADEVISAILHSTQIMERQINRALHEKLNGGLPAFLAEHPVGLHSGMQGLQLRTTAILSDLKKYAFNHMRESYPTNADNQDIVSMSANAANDLREAVEKFKLVIEAHQRVIRRLIELKPFVGPKKLERYLTDGSVLS